MHHQAPEAPGFGILKQLQPRRNPRTRQLSALFTQPGPNAVVQVRAEECLSWVDCGSLPITSRMTAPCRKAAISSDHDENEPPDGGLLLFAGRTALIALCVDRNQCRTMPERAISLSDADSTCQ